MADPQSNPDEQSEADATEFDRPIELDSRNIGPRGFARRTEGSWCEGGSSQVLDPEPEA